jgi:Xaa-Pro aminopeptidase
VRPPDHSSIDPERLRIERLARLHDAMRAHGLDGCLLLHDPNVRYATGASAMPVWSMSTFTRCAVVPAEGSPILFEHPNSVHRSALRAADVRPMHGWEFFDDAAAEAGVFAGEVAAALREVGAAGGRIGIDRLGAPAWLALEREGLTLVDSSPATQEAREVKTPQEVALFRLNGRLVVEALGELEAAIAPGVTERELLAVYATGAIRRGAEYLATNTVCSGTNTNPWRAEATDRALRPGELVFIDTDTVGIEGCFFCVSRTFAVGGAAPSRAARATFRAAHDWLSQMIARVRPGITCAQLADEAPPIPDPYLPQRYEVMLHGVGLEEESPSVCAPLDPQPNGSREIRPDMTLVVECYFGEVGADHGVKVGEEILVTERCPEILAPFPFDEAPFA